MKVLVLGGEGMLGHKVFEVLSRRFDTSATFLDCDGSWREFPQYAGVPEARLLGGVDALRFETVAAAFEQARPDAVVNCVGIIKQSVAAALRGADVVFNAAALKQVPTCEYFPFEAVTTNVGGPENIVRAIQEHELPVETVIGISTDKACKPVNVMGMTKAIQERVFIQANMRCANTRFVCVRYGNVLASRGSVIPLFHEQIRNGGPVTITTTDMTRFLLSLDQAVDTVFAALSEARRGETYIPRVPSALVLDIAESLIGERAVKTEVTGIRPGEKVHEILVSEEESHRTVDRGRYYAILPMLLELRDGQAAGEALEREYSSADDVMARETLDQLLIDHRLTLSATADGDAELLR